MNIEKWIVIGKPANRYSGKAPVRISANKPTVRKNEVAVKFKIELPDNIFDETQFEANMKIDKEVVKKHKLKVDVKNMVSI